MKKTKPTIDQRFLEDVAKQHNKDYPPEYWKSGGRIKPTTDFEEKIKKIAITLVDYGYRSGAQGIVDPTDDGRRIARNSLSDNLSAVSELVEAAFENILDNGHGGGNWRRVIEMERQRIKDAISGK